MHKEKYDNFVNDKTVIKLNDGGDLYYFHDEKLIIIFAYIYSGLVANKAQTKRIFLSAFPLCNLIRDVPLPQKVEIVTKFLVNFSHEAYAMVFELVVDTFNKKASINLIEEPEMGEDLITQEEKKGIQINYKYHPV